MTNKTLSYSLLGLQILIVIFAGIFVFGGQSRTYGGTTNYDAIDVSDGYYIDGTQIIDGSGNWVGTGNFTLTGDLRFKSPVLTGVSTTLTSASTSAITAAQACNSAIINFNFSSSTSVSTVGSSTLPTAEAMFADCLTTDGDHVSFRFRNLNSGSSTILIVGSASTTALVPEATGADIEINAAGWAVITFVRNAFNLMTAEIQEFVAP